MPPFPDEQHPQIVDAAAPSPHNAPLSAYCRLRRAVEPWSGSIFHAHGCAEFPREIRVRMTRAKRLLNSLTFRQARKVAAVTLAIGVVIYVFSVLRWVQLERQELRDFQRQVIHSAAAPASDAAWYLDGSLAARTLDGILALEQVRAAAVRLDDGSVLAADSGMVDDYSPLTRAIAAVTFNDLREVSHELVRQWPGEAKPEKLGTLSVEFDTLAVASRALHVFGTRFWEILLQTLLVAIAISLTFHRFLTKPIIRLGRQVAAVDPEDPQALRIELDQAHVTDELGGLARRIQGTLNLLGETQHELRQLATRDSLTQLPNRAFLMEEIEDAIRRARRSRERFAVFFLDLDQFKVVNDSLGHDVGDHLLVHVSKSLCAEIGDEGWVARLGGDEFVVLRYNLDEMSEAAELAARVIDRINQPARIVGHDLRPGVAVGIAVYPNDGTDARSMLRSADTAMYYAKARGTNQWAYFEREMTDRAMARLTLESALRDAVNAGDFQLHLQPMMTVKRKSVVGAEALIRWPRDGRLVSPSEFIPLAEETGLIVPIGSWVIAEACTLLRRWQDANLELSLSINVSSRQLEDPAFIQIVEHNLKLTGARPNLLVIEITETSLMSNIPRATTVIAALRALGVRIAVDDFGTGHSSLAYLRQLSLDILKVDRSFIATLPGDDVLAKTILALAQEMRLVTVAEGVENERQLGWLRRRGCHAMQGFHLSPALPLDAFEAFLEEAAAGTTAAARPATGWGE
jgi:diguanylate cyclase (GGDEF)-like protein